MTAIPEVPPRSLQPFGETRAVQMHDLERLGVRLCYGRLKPRERANNDKSINVVYIVGTANEQKMADMNSHMERELQNLREEVGHSVTINFLGTHGLDVSSGQPSQPTGPLQGFSGAGGEAGRLGNCYLVAKAIQEGQDPGFEASSVLKTVIRDADIHILGGQEASPDMEAEPPYEPNYLADFFATDSPVGQEQRYKAAETKGLQVVPEAVNEAIRRNQISYQARTDWTGGKVLVEWRLASSPSNWHPELGADGKDRFFYSADGYDNLSLPRAWFEHIISKLVDSQEGLPLVEPAHLVTYSLNFDQRIEFFSRTQIFVNYSGYKRESFEKDLMGGLDLCIPVRSSRPRKLRQS